MSPEFRIDSSDLLLIGAGPGVGAAVVRRCGRESLRGTLVSRGESLMAYTICALGEFGPMRTAQADT